MAILRVYQQMTSPVRDSDVGGLVRFVDLQALTRRGKAPIKTDAGELLSGGGGIELQNISVVHGANSKVVTVRGKGRPDHVQNAKASGLMIDLKLRGRSEALGIKTLLSHRKLGVLLDIEPTGGCWRDEVKNRDRNAVFQATSGNIRGITLTREPQPGQTLEVID